jgi:pre-mRNA-splicing factor ISY1
LSDGPIPALSDIRSPNPSAKRKSTDQDGDVDMPVADEDPSLSKPTVSVTAAPLDPKADQARIHAQAAAAYIPFLTTEDLIPPKMPTREEMETVLLGLRKQALVEEYFGTDGSS